MLKWTREPDGLIGTVERMPETNDGLTVTVKKGKKKMSEKTFAVVQIYTGEKINTFHNSFPCDPEKIKAAIKRFEPNLRQASLKLGFGDSSLGNAINRGLLSNVMLTSLKNVYGIDPEEYRYIPKPKDEPVQPTAKENEAPLPDPADYTELITRLRAIESAVKALSNILPMGLMETDTPLIQKAVAKGVDEAIQKNMNNLRGMVYSALISAEQNYTTTKKQASPHEWTTKNQ